jgi:ubiquinone/menaquinone biosynthesis C-methylase UbiE
MEQRSNHDATVVDQFTRQAEAYGQLVRSMPSDRSAGLRALVGITADDVVLDVACGTGLRAMQLAPHVRAVVGVDLTPAMLEEAKAEQARLGIANVSWQAVDACHLPFADESFSIVLCQAAFHHFDQPAAVLAEMARVCRKGGRVSVSDMTPDPAKVEAFDAMERLRDPSHAHAHTRAEVLALAEGLPLAVAGLTQPTPTHIPLEVVLATSHPEACTLEDIRRIFRDDADSGQDRLGLSARMTETGLVVSYPMSTFVWTRS